MLLRIRAVGPGEDPIDDEADYSDAEDDVEAYDSTVVDAASLVIAPARKEPTRLSALLEAARSWDREVEELVRLSVLWAFAPEFDDEIPGATLDLIDPDMAVVRSGELLVTEGWTGDDLVVGPAHLLAQLDGDALVNVENDESCAEDEADEDLAVVKT
jgi:hypothetical protein